MKTLHVIPSVSAIRGGPSHAVLQTVKSLRALGFDSQIATTNDNGSEQLLDVPLNQQVDYEGVPTWFFSRLSLPNKGFTLNRDKAFLFSMGLTQWLWQHVKDYDLIETRYLFSYASTSARIIARWQKVPYIAHPTGQLSPWALAQSRFKKQVYTFLVERHNLDRASAIQSSSLDEAQDIRNFGIQTPVFTVPVGVNQPQERLDAKEKLRNLYGIALNTPIVVFLSRLHYKKRPELLLQALAQLSSHRDFHIVLAGSGDLEYLESLKQLINSLQLTHRTSLPGFVGGLDKEILLQGSDIFVLPSFSENFGVAVAEAMAVGLPVVVTPGVQIAPDIAAAQAGLVVEGEVEPLSAAIAQLLQSPELRQQLGDNGRRFAQSHYSWEAIAQQLAAAYTAIIQKQPLPRSLTHPQGF